MAVFEQGHEGRAMRRDGGRRIRMLALIGAVAAFVAAIAVLVLPAAAHGL